jgi:hypothetical protein
MVDSERLDGFEAIGMRSARGRRAPASGVDRRKQLKEELRRKIIPLLTPTILEAIPAMNELSDIDLAQFIALTLGQTPPWGSVTAQLAGEILREEASKHAAAKKS